MPLSSALLPLIILCSGRFRGGVGGEEGEDSCIGLEAILGTKEAKDSRREQTAEGMGCLVDSSDKAATYFFAFPLTPSRKVSAQPANRLKPNFLITTTEIEKNRFVLGISHPFILTHEVLGIF